MPLKELLFSSKGRIPRSTWWYYGLASGGIMVGIYIVFIAILAVIGSAISIEDASAPMVFLLCISVPIYLLFFYTSLMVSIKRCHDRNRSGWFLLFSYVPSIIYSIFSLVFPAANYSYYYGSGPSAADSFAIVLSCIVSLAAFGLGLWVTIELGFLKGTVGPNQYGDDPTTPKFMGMMPGYQVPGQPGYRDMASRDMASRGMASRELSHRGWSRLKSGHRREWLARAG